jgi:hypothetical protein
LRGQDRKRAATDVSKVEEGMFVDRRSLNN